MSYTPCDLYVSLVDELSTIGDFIRFGASEFERKDVFFGHGTSSAWDEACHLVLAALQLPWDVDQRVFDCRLTLQERQALAQALERRVEGRQPTAYIVGFSYFAGLKFKVDERVLVPRSPFAELIENEFQPWVFHPPARILDLCTGSGCIGIACAYAFPDAEVVLSDISADAIEVANDNIHAHHLSDQVSAVESDLFANLQDERFDLIISNPPYVNAEDLAAMPEEYQNEPELALGSGDDGLDFTRRLLSLATDYLTEEGVLIVEVGNSWPDLEAAYPEIPFTWLEFESGGHGVFMLTAQQLRALA